MDFTAKYVPEKFVISAGANMSLCFTLRVPVINYIRGAMPNAFDMDGIMGRPAEVSSLPDDLKDTTAWETATGGFVLVAFGSWVDNFSESIVKQLLHTLSTLQFPVIWKVKDKQHMTRIHSPAHILNLSWIPQN